MVAITRTRSPLTRRRFPSVPSFRYEFDRLFDELTDRSGGEWGSFAPPVNFFETEDDYIVEAELPGMSREDIRVSVEQNTLMISGERSTESEVEHENYYLQERSHGRFNRSFSLPASISTDEVSADYENGILRVRMPKMAEAKTRQIEVNVK